MTNPRRRSNSSTHHGPAGGMFTTKFETHDPEPVFEEELHGPEAEDEAEGVGHTLEKESSTDSVSVSGASVEAEEHASKV